MSHKACIGFARVVLSCKGPERCKQVCLTPFASDIVPGYSVLLLQTYFAWKEYTESTSTVFLHKGPRIFVQIHQLQLVSHTYPGSVYRFSKCNLYPAKAQNGVHRFFRYCLGPTEPSKACICFAKAVCILLRSVTACKSLGSAVGVHKTSGKGCIGLTSTICVLQCLFHECMYRFPQALFMSWNGLARRVQTQPSLHLANAQDTLYRWVSVMCFLQMSGKQY